MVHSPQDFDLILETVELLRMGTQQFLAENLSSKALTVLETHHLVHGGRCATAQLADGLEIGVKTCLAQPATQDPQPNAS